MKGTNGGLLRFDRRLWVSYLPWMGAVLGFILTVLPFPSHTSLSTGREEIYLTLSRDST